MEKEDSILKEITKKETKKTLSSLQVFPNFSTLRNKVKEMRNYMEYNMTQVLEDANALKAQSTHHRSMFSKAVLVALFPNNFKMSSIISYYDKEDPVV